MSLLSMKLLLRSPALLLAAPDAAARATLVASAIVELLPDTACAIHRFTPGDGDAAWTAIAAAGDISIEQMSMPAGGRLISELLTDEPRALIYRGSDIRREDYSICISRVPSHRLPICPAPS